MPKVNANCALKSNQMSDVVQSVGAPVIINSTTHIFIIVIVNNGIRDACSASDCATDMLPLILVVF